MQDSAGKYTKREISIDLLRSLVSFDPETGLLWWRERPDSLFAKSSDAAAWNARYSGRPAFTNRDRRGYLRAAFFGAHFFAHRVIFALHYGRWPSMVDHVNGEPSDNRIANLREVTSVENGRNMRKTSRNKSGHLGVSFRKGSWNARICSGGKQISLGSYRTLAQAIAARKAGERQFGFHSNHGRA